MAFAISLLLCSGCSVDDDRDICCEEVVLDYRYVRQNRDEYNRFIHRLRHFLFDASGRFVQEVASNPTTPQRVRLRSLEAGRYTMITVGNASLERTILPTLTPAVSMLEDLRLATTGQAGTGALPNADQLFWNERTFTVERQKRHRYICDLSNIHCHLFVKVFWQSNPPHNGGKYTVQLEEVATSYTLNPAHVHTSKVIRPDATDAGTGSSERRVIHTFPGLGGTFGRHRIDEALYGVTLYGELITLRYTNLHIPTLRLYYQGEPISKPIDLTKAFASWSWQPDEHPEQIYRLELEILDNGNVVVSQWAQTSVNDWVDGGTVGSKI